LRGRKIETKNIPDLKGGGLALGDIEALSIRNGKNFNILG